MKRNSAGDPIVTVHRWTNVPLSCRACRSKKRKCDRRQPCSNCRQRRQPCEYEVGAGVLDVSQAPNSGNELDTALDPSEQASENVSRRLARLEQAVFNNTHASTSIETWTSPVLTSIRKTGAQYTPFCSHSLSSPYEPSVSATTVSRSLPPLEQARILFQHFAKTSHQNMMILHLPFARDLMEQLYTKSFNEHTSADLPSIFLLLCCFSGSALTWTPELLDKLHATQAEAKAAFQAYSQMAMVLIDHPTALTSSTIVLVSMTMLAQIVLNSEGLVVKSHTIRARCLLMARDMRVHYLDSPYKHTEVGRNVSNEIEKEMQRRAWWYLVGSDWLSAFSDVYQEGVYIFHPRHMIIKYPKHVDDAALSATMEAPELPLSHATDMSAAIYRIQLASLCREIADHMPWTGGEEEYATILSLDQKFQGYLADLPVHLRMDPLSIQKSKELCSQRPSLAIQRLGLNFSLHTRRCRLHRGYHLKGMLESKYAYSRTTCVAAAQKVLELRRSMEGTDSNVGFKPARFWTVMHHVILATLVLATDVSWDPASPGAKAREEKVLAAYRLLEKSKKEASGLIDVLQKSMQNIMTKLREKDAALGNTVDNTISESVEGASVQQTGHLGLTDRDDTFLMHLQRVNNTQVSPSSALFGNSSIAIADDVTNMDWDPIWSEFLALAPDFNGMQWNMLFDEMDLQL